MMQDFFFSVPTHRRLADHTPTKNTWVGRVVQFLSADILEPNDEVRTRDLALVEWLCTAKTPTDERVPIEVWTDHNLCYEPAQPWTDIIDVDRILGPEPVVPYSRWPTIPARFWNAPPKAHLSHWATPHERFKYGNADKPGRPGSGSKMFIRQVMLRKVGRLHPRAPDEETEERVESSDGGTSSDAASESSESDED